MPRPGHSVRTILCVSLLLLLIPACNSSSFPSTQSPTLEDHTSVPAVTSSASMEASAAVGVTLIPSAVASKTASANSAANFKVAVIVDTLSVPVTREQAQSVIDEGSKFLQTFTPFGLEMAGFVEDGSGGTTQEMANRFIASHEVEPPDGIVIFSFGDGSRARLSGGYGYALPAPAGSRNAFVPLAGGAAQISVAIVNFKQMYMPCGYGTSTAVQSATALAGECLNQPGTACVQHNGYSMCANAVDNLYTSTPTHYVTSTMIHELLQPFAPGGEKDNYATAECSAHMGYPAGFFDLQESQYYNDLCPFVYDNFVKSYQP